MSVGPPQWALSRPGAARIFGVAWQNTLWSALQEAVLPRPTCSARCSCRVSATLALHGEIGTTSSTRTTRLKMENGQS